MIKKVIVALLVASIILIPSVLAEEHTCPAPGPAFGKHISEMTPDHAKAHGQMFGDMVSNMATGTQTPCH